MAFFNILLAFIVLSNLHTHVDAALLANFSSGPPIYGVVVIDDDIFVVKDSQPEINIYKGDTLQLKLNASLPGIAGPYDMVRSSKQDDLFILDWFRFDEVIRVQLDSRFDSSAWKFTQAYTSASLSMTPDKRVIVTKAASASFSEYTTAGQLIKTIQLQNISSPRHVIKISGNQYAVCFGYYANETHKVCTVDAKGKTLKCFGGLPGNSTSQFNVPARMLLATNGAIIVADMNNGRIVELSASLTKMTVVISRDDGLTRPYRMFLDVARKRLFVANNQLDPVTGYAVSGNLMAFDYK